MNIPPLISRTPPPLPDDDDDEDDEEFGSYVIGEIIDNGNSDLFRSINIEPLTSAYDFIPPGGVVNVKDSPEKINFYKNGVDSPTTSSAKDHLPDVIPDCEPVVPSSNSLGENVLFNGKSFPSEGAGQSSTDSDCCELSNGVRGLVNDNPENESDSFVRGVPSTKPGVTDIILDENHAGPRETWSEANVTTNLEENFGWQGDVHSTEASVITDDETALVNSKELVGQDECSVESCVPDVMCPPVTESPSSIDRPLKPLDGITDGDIVSSSSERPTYEDISSNCYQLSDGIKGCAHSSIDPPEPNACQEAPSVPEVDPSSNCDSPTEQISIDADEFTNFAFEKPVDPSYVNTDGTADLGISLSHPESGTTIEDFCCDNKSTISDNDEFTSFAFEKPVDFVSNDEACGNESTSLGGIPQASVTTADPLQAGPDEFTSFTFENPIPEDSRSGTADSEGGEFSDFADFQMSSETEFAFQEAAPVSKYQIEDVIPAEAVEEFNAALVGKIDANTVWCRLRYLEDTPALKYQWLSSSSNHKLLSALKIDSRNIFCGPWSRSSKILGPDSRAGPYHDVAGMPSAGYHEGCNLHDRLGDANVKPSVPDAHFDWEGSGLVNPLFSSAKDDEILHCDIGGIIGNQMSSEASTILKSLPDLSYMTKTYLVFKPLPTPL